MEEFETNRLASSTELMVRTPSGLRAESEILDVASDQRIDLGAYWDVILRRRWVILSTLLIIFFYNPHRNTEREAVVSCNRVVGAYTARAKCS